MKRTGLLLAFLLLSACGQKGPLYLPDEPPPARTRTPCDAPDAPCRRGSIDAGTTNAQDNKTP